MKRYLHSPGDKMWGFEPASPGLATGLRKKLNDSGGDDDDDGCYKL